jgi:hypothetical protein
MGAAELADSKKVISSMSENQVVPTGNGLHSRGVGVQFWAWGKKFFFSPQRRALEVKRLGYEAGLSPPFNAEVKNGGARPSLPPYFRAYSFIN